MVEHDEEVDVEQERRDWELQQSAVKRAHRLMVTDDVRAQASEITDLVLPQRV